MYLCPHCQFENPTQNRFCQRCGHALRVLQAIILPAGVGAEATVDLAAAAADEELMELSSATVVTPQVTGPTVATLLTEGQTLKGENRYQLLHSADATKPLNDAEITLSVLDCAPADDSPLVQFLETLPDDVEEADIDNMIPPLAFPYWRLQEDFYPMVPELQAAWNFDEYTFTVVEDRSNWRTLTDFVDAEQVEPLELVHWLYEMLTLWTALSIYEAESSLLAQENLRVDDDQVVCLQRLIFNPSDRPPTLQTLGKFWQAWMTELAEHKIVALDSLIADMVANEVVDAPMVKSRLADIAEQIQEATVVTSPLPISMPDPNWSEDAVGSQPEAASVDAIGISIKEKGSEAAPTLTVDDLLIAADLEDFEETEDAEERPDDGGLNDLPTMALPLTLARLDEVGRTHVGRQRSHNEDSFFAETQIYRTDSPAGVQLKARGLYILCDGMGGHSGGEVASQLAVTTLRSYFAEHWQTALPDETVIRTGILQANEVIFNQNESEARAGSARMGTTLVAMLVADQQVVIAHVGDSRLYCLNRQGLTQTTVDHEVGQREINRGVEPAIAYARPDAYQLTQALGPRSNKEVAPSITQLTVNQDTLFLLCSDGLSDNDLLETHVESHLEPMMRSKADLEEGVADLIDLANEHNGHDNITAIAVRFKLRPNLDPTP
ncbi:MAG: serine/threonine phosphatase [Cyanobacteria bacterium P01_C01_bin.120]